MQKNISLRISKNKNGTYGIKNINNNLVFFKQRKDLSNGFEEIKNTFFDYTYPLYIDKKQKTSYYQFDSDLYNNTLYDDLYFKGKYWNKKRKWFSLLEKNMIDTYKLLPFEETMSKKFFIDRIVLLDKSINYSIYSDILKEVKDFILSINNYKFRSYISNGDLTDTNICLNNKLCDTECYGYNIVLADLAILFVSILYGCWIYPKYNYNAYLFRKNRITIPKKRLNKRQVYILKKVIFLVDPIEFDIFKNLIIMRLVTPITLDRMDDCDKNNIDSLIRTIYLSDYDTIINCIKKFYKE